MGRCGGWELIIPPLTNIESMICSVAVRGASAHHLVGVSPQKKIWGEFWEDSCQVGGSLSLLSKIHA